MTVLVRHCRVCGAVGSLYLSGEWCAEHSPHPPTPVPPPSGLVPRMPSAPLKRGPVADDPGEGLTGPVGPRAAALVARVEGIAAKAPRTVGDPYVREGRTETSFAAAMKALPKSGTQRRLILDLLVDAAGRGYLGATDPELSRRLELPGNSVRPRRGELVEMGLAEPSGHTRRHDGNDHTVWRPTAAALAALGVLPG